MFSLSGLDGSVAINGRTVTVKHESVSKVLAAESIRGTAVWTGVLTGQFSVHYVPVPRAARGKESAAGSGSGAGSRVAASSVEYVSVQFKAADKDFWDAMAAAIMTAARAAASAAAAPAIAKQPTDAPPSPEAAPPHGFDNWLNRTLGLEQDSKVR